MIDTTFELPLPVSFNHMYRTKAGGGVYKTEEATRWAIVAAALLRHQHVPHFPVNRDGSAQQPLAVELIACYYLGNTRSDLDNYNKAVLDALALHMGFNDNRTWHLRTIKEVDRDNPRVEGRIRELGPDTWRQVNQEVKSLISSPSKPSPSRTRRK